MATKINLVKKIKVKDAVMFTGLPGIGLVGKIAVDYMLKQFKAEKIAEIYSDSFPPSIHTRNSLIELIKDELYHYKFQGKDYLFLAGPVQPSLDIRFGSAQEHYEFAEAIVREAKKLGVKEIYTLAGINVGEKRMNAQPKIVIAATNKKIIQEFKKLNATEGQEEGLISGAAGLIIGIAAEEGIHGACLMGETNARLIYGDHGSAQKLIELLVKKFKFKVNMDEIGKESKNIEQAFQQLSKQLEEEQQEQLPPDSSLSYVR
ncbi:MAG: PAC2 family protein [Candidatus Diapherotrites archaeon]